MAATNPGSDTPFSHGSTTPLLHAKHKQGHIVILLRVPSKPGQIAQDSRAQRIWGPFGIRLHQQGKVEIASSSIGELVMEHLRQLDRVAYIRFASVYRAFADVDSFKEEVEALAKRVDEKASLPAQLPLIEQKEFRLLGETRSKKR